MKRLLSTLAVLVFVVPALAQAQDDAVLSSLSVSVWPEFDRPEALVIYRGVFSDGVESPVPVEIRIPISAGAPTAVAYVDSGGQRFNQQYTTRVEGDWLVVAFELTAQGFQLEYYDAMEVSAEGQRSYVLDLVADYAIQQLDLDVQVPPAAQGFDLTPPADSVVVEADGLTYHLASAADVAQDEQLGWSLSYQKDNEDLTVSSFSQPTSQSPSVPAAAPSATSQSGDSTIWVFLIAFVGLVAVGAAAFWLGRRTQAPSADSPSVTKKQKRRGSGRGPGLGDGGALNSGLFCHKCGAQLRADSEFCHKCGTTIRKG
jgi:hypothetical protein